MLKAWPVYMWLWLGYSSLSSCWKLTLLHDEATQANLLYDVWFMCMWLHTLKCSLSIYIYVASNVWHTENYKCTCYRGALYILYIIWYADFVLDSTVAITLNTEIYFCWLYCHKAPNKYIIKALNLPRSRIGLQWKATLCRSLFASRLLLHDNVCHMAL